MRNVVLGVAMVLAAPVTAAPFRSDRIAVAIEGSGPDVLLIPGLTSSPWAFSTVTPLAPGYRYHLVQVKGFAGTPREGNAPDGKLLPALADELARYARAAKIRPAVVGHSMGGSTALLLAAHHPDVVSKVMVVDMPAYMGAMFVGPDAKADAVNAMARAQAQMMAAADEATYRQRIAGMTGGMVANAKMRPKVIEQALASDRALVNATFAEITMLDLRPALANIGVPAEVLYVTPAGIGVTDAQIDAGYRTSYANLKGVTLTRVPASAHFVMFDNPAFFAGRLQAFLTR